jgi:hypothetical protein
MYKKIGTRLVFIFGLGISLLTWAQSDSNGPINFLALSSINTVLLIAL